MKRSQPRTGAPKFVQTPCSGKSRVLSDVGSGPEVEIQRADPLEEELDQGTAEISPRRICSLA